MPPEIAQRSAPTVKSGARPTFALYTLGCKVNQYDSHQIARILVSKGFRRVEFRESADLYVIDTCTVTSHADKKSRQAASRARRNNPDAVVAVTGCAATKDALQFERAAPGALILSNAQKFELPERAIARLKNLENWAQNYADFRAQTGSEPVPSPTRERAVLKIQDGCNHKCSYCIIPRVRGESVLKSRVQLMREAREFVSEGAREIVVTGVSMGDFRGQEPEIAGQSRNAEINALLRAVSSIEGLERVRTSSLDPADVDVAWLETVAQTPKVMPHIHLALQSGSRGVLRRMRRRYLPELYLKWAQKWREIAPDAGLTTDVIVGFPGETESEWQETLALCRAAKFSAIHVFPYSPREETFAANHLQELGGLVSVETQKRRVAELIELGNQLSGEFAFHFLWKENEILVENIGDGWAEGLTPAYLKARVETGDAKLQKGDLVRFVAQSFDAGVLAGKMV
ncbi:threonylcarbamoyladenosine tRNA methylthiotransferase MtaB [Abditibacterium utsteinense]|uniref:Threonylcarbamoyladenosine tRNA methylthiotransferase MtaB n=2 Tax=Abditibacterium utsteinense TaxID=1960156 RepID=A0A2S8SP46_9BACT|nr:threonylcarbamoyladenosine tRNA methylthiotransferase MtaB [Abditibacterium utsteinense]